MVSEPIPLRIVYAGTPAFAVPALDALLRTSHSVAAVYTQPDRPAGRGHQLKASAVKQFAAAHGLAVEQPLNFRDIRTVERLRAYKPDVIVVAAYGLLLPQAVLDIPTFACVNIHASLLPRWRGAAPIQRAILAGDVNTGVTIMRMEAGLDTGPILRTHAIEIAATDNAATLHDRLSRLGAQTLVEVVNELPDALVKAQTQSELGVSYAKKIDKGEAVIDWSRTAVDIDRQIRAFNPWPVAETRMNGAQLRVWEARPRATATAAATGAIIAADADGVHVATGHGMLTLTRVQLAGRKAMPAAEFINAQPLAGMILGD